MRCTHSQISLGATLGAIIPGQQYGASHFHGAAPQTQKRSMETLTPNQSFRGPLLSEEATPSKGLRTSS